MTRKKVKLAYITNDSARKATFKKRKKGLVKKVSELSTLCGVGACAIIYSPYEAQPEVWPGGAGRAERVVSEFKMMPEMEQSKKMVNQESFLKQRLAKVKEQLKKLHKDNREKEITCLMYRTLTLTSSSSSSSNTYTNNNNAKGGGNGNLLLQGLSMVDLNDLGWIIDQNLKDIHTRIDALTKDMMPTTTTTTAAAAAAAAGHHWVPSPPPPPHQLPQVLVKEKKKEEEVEEEEKKVVVVGLGLGNGGGPGPGGVEAVVGTGSSSSSTGRDNGVEAAMLQNPWLMNLLSSNDHMMGFCGGGGEDLMNMMLPSFGDPHPHNAFWSSFFP